MNKKDFPIFKTYPDLIYLDNAATTQKPQIMLDSLNDFYTKSNANVHRGIYALSEKATLKYEETRSKIAKFINAKKEEIIFTSGTTMSLNLIAKYYISKIINKGDIIIISILEHHSNLLPWQDIANELGAELIYLPLDKDQNIDTTKLNEILRTGRVKVISLAHMSNVLGTVTNFPVIRDLIDSISPKTILIADSAQSAAHIDIDTQILGCDFLVFSAHKVYGPLGLGILWAKRDILESIDPFFTGGGMIGKVTKESSTWADIPEKFEAGTPSIASAVSFGHVVRYLETIGKQKIYEHEFKLASDLFLELTRLKGIKTLLHEFRKGNGPVISFYSDTIHPHDLVQKLSYKNIALRAGHHCASILHKDVFGIHGSVRASISMYNTKEDIDTLIMELKRIIKEG